VKSEKKKEKRAGVKGPTPHPAPGFHSLKPTLFLLFDHSY